MEDVFDLSNSEAGSFLSNKTKENDGLLRPKIEQGRDGKRELVIRILPNLMKNGKIGTTALEKHIHYADFKNNPELQGYFDCLKNSNIGKDCILCKTYWALKQSNNPKDQDKAKLINRSTKYYCYAYVVEDQQVPENEGKIFIFPFGYKIFQKIKAKAESTRKPVKVEDLIHGANLQLVIQEVGGFYNYDASEFEAPGPIEFNGKQLKVGEDGKISDSEKKRVVEFLQSREFELEDFLPKEWSSEQYDKANKIVSLLSGVNYDASSAQTNTTNNAQPLTSANVFDDSDDDEEDEKPKTVAKKSVKKESEPTLNDAKKKVSAFFDDDDDDN